MGRRHLTGSAHRTSLRIIAGTHRGRPLRAPPGLTTRPTAQRLRQALFDMLLHAPWAGRAALADARVLDAFAGTGALGLEALSRGAAHVTFLETDRAALAALRANIDTLREAPRTTVVAADATRPPPADAACGLILLDPPYGQGWVARALPALHAAGWLAAGALVVAEMERGAAPPAPPFTPLAERAHGAGTLHILRAP